ncbi:hypothetical protein COY93_00510 [Candidatus Uhrbacteria bacterium CG_4_10_14_0_8_um_filter_58_22]|uniref:Glycosyltransferase 2-like domain-containing protein n=1 Tax=Candidatus Uhrbacteria bacterium CG_4_10_14_0_8_um_filter_58_22 TaxID=1975029 RepID=A0A2M7QAU5_9BACT|nr:MAG: hypothetical protein COY93_00510 [Candidatus Uhrbacteria bacterium CG_4_10_14_0_8_um_filter_58_22]
MDLSVVILNWKVRELLRRCLTSVFEQTVGLSFEVIVVDNDSGDGSAEMVRREFPQVRMIENSGNLGFSAGNNPGIAVAGGEFVLLLNPDTELRSNALAGMVRVMRDRPDLGVLGPRLLNPDGSLQESVRAFPGTSDQAMIMLKLHRVFPKRASLRRYLCDDFDYSAAADVDQVMGAAFLTRRSVLDRIGPLDEDYFIWFEEVDFCRRVRAAGLRVGYTPEAEVVHWGGESFAQEMGPTKQRFWNASLRTYMRKHGSLMSRLMVTLLHPVSMALSWAVHLASGSFRGGRGSKSRHWSGPRLFLVLLSGYILLELVSWIGYNFSWLNQAAFFVVVLAVAVLSWYRPWLGVIAVLGELFVGSQGGYLLAVGPADVDGAVLSLRMGLFLAVFGTWMARTALGLAAGLRRRSFKAPAWYVEMRSSGLLWPYLALLTVLAFGGLRGLLAGNGFGNVFFDANGYAFFALFPAFVEGWPGLRTGRTLWYVLAAAMTVLVAKSLAVLYFFSHHLFYVAANMYVWVRDTRVGEVTVMTADFHRVFFQSHLFLLAGVFVVLLLAVAAPRLLHGRSFWVTFGLMTWGLVGLLLGLSRSFWFGGFVGTGVMVGLLLWTGGGRGLWRRMALVAPLSLIAAVAIITAVYVFPFPNKTGDMSLTSLIGGRAFSLSGEAAANSRWALLPELWNAGWRHPVFGSGLGTEVTYITSDPRLLVDNPTGRYTTFAFEWGYHDLWIKFGLLGLVVYAWLVAAVLKPTLLFIREGSVRRLDGKGRLVSREVLIAVGAVSGVAALLGTHIFSPYLNHPLGIGLLMAAAAWGLSLRREGDIGT